MSTRRRWMAWVLGVAALAGLLAYLRDPPWLGRVTSGLSTWTRDRAGTPFRWTTGHATFYVRSDVDEITVPVRAVGANLPVHVRIDLDGRTAHIARIADEHWHAIRLRVASVPASRRHRRVEVRVDRTYSRFYRGVQLGVVSPPGILPPP